MKNKGKKEWEVFLKCFAKHTRKSEYHSIRQCTIYLIFKNKNQKNDFKFRFWKSKKKTTFYNLSIKNHFLLLIMLIKSIFLVLQKPLFNFLIIPNIKNNRNFLQKYPQIIDIWQFKNLFCHFFIFSMNKNKERSSMACVCFGLLQIRK